MPTLGLVMIARDEARCIARSLDSLRPWVDRMVVLDTGSSDATPEIAHQCGAEVHRFTWCDDFSVARNAALALGGCDWHLVVDADEWLLEGGPALAALRTTTPDFVGRLLVDSSFEADGRIARSASWLPRVLPAGVRYTGRVHEQPRHALPLRRLPVRLDHDGYRPGPMQAKGTRNRRLLEQDLAQRPHDGYLWYQLGKDHEVHGRHEAACIAYREALSRSDARVAWRHDLVVRALHVLARAQRLEEALTLAGAEMPHWPQSADFHFTLGDVLLTQAQAQPEAAGELLPLIEASWLRCLEIGESHGIEGAVQGRGSHLAAHNLVVFYESLGLPDRAAPYRALAVPA